MAISFAPKDAGQGLKDDYRGKISAAICERWLPKPGLPLVPAAHFSVVDDAGETDEVYLSAGSLDTIIPTDDGEEFGPAEGKTGVKINQNANLMVFFRELMNVAADKKKVEDKLASGKISELLGLELHLKRQLKKGFTAKDGKVVADSQVLVPVKIYNEEEWLSGKAAASVSTGSSKGNGAAVDEELKGLVEAALVEAITAAGGKLPKKAVSQAVFKAFSKDPARKQAAMALALSEGFLGGDDVAWQYDKKELVIAE